MQGCVIFTFSTSSFGRRQTTSLKVRSVERRTECVNVSGCHLFIEPFRLEVDINKSSASACFVKEHDIKKRSVVLDAVWPSAERMMASDATP